MILIKRIGGGEDASNNFLESTDPPNRKKTFYYKS